MTDEEEFEEKQIVPIETAIAERKGELVVVKGELAVIRERKKVVTKNVTKAKYMATPPGMRSVDEVKRRSRLPKHLRKPGIELPHQDAFYKWLNELEIESARLSEKEVELFSKLNDLRDSVDVLKKVNEELTPRRAYKILRTEAKKNGMKVSRRITVDNAKYIYRNIAKMYHPDSYRNYAQITGLTSGEEAEEKFKELVIILGLCYKKICEST